MRLSPAQLWGIIAAVAVSTFVFAGGLYSIKADLLAVRVDLAHARESVETEIGGTLATVKEIKIDRAEALREWGQWRSSIDARDSRQDAELSNHEKLIQELRRVRP